MNVLFYGLGLIFIAWFVHFFLWKFYLPKNQISALLCIFFAVLIGGLFVFWKFPDYIKFFGISTLRTACEYLQLSFLFISLTLAYTVTYSAVEVDSPSLGMVLYIAQEGPEGLEKDVLEQKMGGNTLVTDRIGDLLAGGFISLGGQLYKLESKGRLIARIFVIYRKLLKAQKGG